MQASNVVEAAKTVKKVAKTVTKTAKKTASKAKGVAKGAKPSGAAFWYGPDRPGFLGESYPGITDRVAHSKWIRAASD